MDPGMFSQFEAFLRFQQQNKAPTESVPSTRSPSSSPFTTSSVHIPLEFDTYDSPTLIFSPCFVSSSLSFLIFSLSISLLTNLCDISLEFSSSHFFFRSYMYSVYRQDDYVELNTSDGDDWIWYVSIGFWNVLIFFYISLFLHHILSYLTLAKLISIPNYAHVDRIFNSPQKSHVADARASIVDAEVQSLSLSLSLSQPSLFPFFHLLIFFLCLLCFWMSPSIFFFCRWLRGVGRCWLYCCFNVGFPK